MAVASRSSAAGRAASSSGRPAPASPASRSTALLDRDGFFARSRRRRDVAPRLAGRHAPLAARAVHFPAKAKSCIFLFMYGGPSSVDMFDYKPELQKQRRQDHRRRDPPAARSRSRSCWPPGATFKQYGQSGLWCSRRPAPPVPAHGQAGGHQEPVRRLVRPRLGDDPDEQRADHPGPPVDRLLARLRAGHGEPEPARLRGHARPPRRADQRRRQLVQRLHARRLPGHRVPVRRPADPQPRARRRATTADMQRDQIDTINRLNADHLAARPGYSELQARIASYELAFQLQSTAPEALDLSSRGRDDPRDVRPERPQGRPPAVDRPRPVRPAVPDRPPARRARRPLRPDLQRRRPPAAELGRPQRHRGEPQDPLPRGRQADRRPARPTWSSAACWKKRWSSSAASSAGSPSARAPRRPRPQPQGLHLLARRRRRQGRHQLRRDGRDSATPPSSTATTSATCTPPSCT